MSQNESELLMQNVSESLVYELHLVLVLSVQILRACSGLSG